MILRRAVSSDAQENSDNTAQLEGGATTPLRWRLAMLTSLVVAIGVGAVTVVTYWAVSTSMTALVDAGLESKSNAVLDRTVGVGDKKTTENEVASFKSYNPDIRISVQPASWTYAYGDMIPVGDDFGDPKNGVRSSVSTVGSERIMTKRLDDGTTVVLAQSMEQPRKLLTTLGVVLLVILGLGILLAIAAGIIVASAGSKPLERLQRAVNRVAETDELRPIPVTGHDEVAQLTMSFNEMLAALQESRDRQNRLVADAGHELKTPLTSIRTNIELLMMVNQPGQRANISEQDLADLQSDVVAQLNEMSTLIGDLVDLAREDTPDRQMEDVDLDEVLLTSMQRSERRRADVSFTLDAIPWTVRGDESSLGRACLNLMHNAAKWSPEGGVVRVKLERLDKDHARLAVSDSGPGIRPEERERVFERFYRSTEARSTPGSGLGLAIVKSVMEGHGGSIHVEESNDGGAKMVADFPGRPSEPETEDFDTPAAGQKTRSGEWKRVFTGRR